jgi:putative transposase
LLVQSQVYQYVSARYRAALAKYGLLGSMSAPANPCDNAQAESFMKALKVEEFYLGAYETFADVAARLSVFIEDVYNAKRMHSALDYLSPDQYEQNLVQQAS